MLGLVLAFRVRIRVSVRIMVILRLIILLIRMIASRFPVPFQTSLFRCAAPNQDFANLH